MDKDYDYDYDHRATPRSKKINRWSTQNPLNFNTDVTKTTITEETKA